MKDHDVFWKLDALSDRQLLERVGWMLGSSRRLMAELIAAARSPTTCDSSVEVMTASLPSERMDADTSSEPLPSGRRQSSGHVPPAR